MYARPDCWLCSGGIPGPRHLLYTTILVFALCGMSLTVLTGWAGQLSLGQMAFAGIGAMLTATFIRGLSLDIGRGDTRILKAGIEPLPTGPAIILAVLITAALAALVGLTALRAQGSCSLSAPSPSVSPPRSTCTNGRS
jgi:ABC-type branched-subunit amino acid transport system permease subunit